MCAITWAGSRRITCKEAKGFGLLGQGRRRTSPKGEPGFMRRLSAKARAELGAELYQGEALGQLL
jgi:hypothetical protein